MLKRTIIKSFLKYDVKSNIKGRLRISFKKYNMLPKDFEKYLIYIKEAYFYLKGIKEVSINQQTGSILIVYDAIVVDDKKILKWTNVLIDEGISVYEDITALGLLNVNEIELLAKEKLKNIFSNRINEFI